MAVIEFKSVGERFDAKKFVPETNEIPIGIKTPLRFGTKNDGIFAMHFDAADQIRDNFRNLLLTNHGERLGLYNFGANLRSLSFELGQDTFDVQAITNIQTAINRFMSFIEPRTFESKLLPSGNANVDRVDISIVYDVPRLGISNQKIIVTISVGG